MAGVSQGPSFYAWPVTVESVRLRLLLIGPVRLVLSIAWLAAARAAGGRSGPTLLAFAAGAFVIAFLVPNDPRARFRRGPDEPAELPADASVAPAWLHVVHAALPSTVGVSVLAAITLAFQPTLAALLRAYGIDGRLYVDPRGRALFRR